MYRRNGKQVLHGNEHCADAVSVDVAEEIVRALNASGGHMVITPRDDSPDLFGLNVVIDPSVAPRTVQFRHPDGRTDTLLVPDEPHCSIRQYGDQYACVTHRTQWDVDDTPPDSCQVPS